MIQDAQGLGSGIEKTPKIFRARGLLSPSLNLSQAREKGKWPTYTAIINHVAGREIGQGTGREIRIIVAIGLTALQADLRVT